MSAFSIIGALGGIVSVIGLPITLWLYYKSRKVYRLHYYAFPPFLVYSQSEDTPFKVFYFDRDVQAEATDISIHNVIIWNTGTETITRHLVAETDPIRVSFPVGTISAASVASRTRSVIDAHVNVSDDRKSAVVSFAFLDRGDGFTLRFVVEGKPEKPDLNGTLIGGRIVTLPRRKDLVRDVLEYASMSSLVGLLASGLIIAIVRFLVLREFDLWLLYALPLFCLAVLLTSAALAVGRDPSLSLPRGLHPKEDFPFAMFGYPSKLGIFNPPRRINP